MAERDQPKTKKRKSSTAESSSSTSTSSTADKLISKSSYTKGEQISPHEGNTLVFKGFFNKTIPIALKRYMAANNDDSKEYKRALERLSSPNFRHPNLIRYFGIAKDADCNFKFLAVELCECSVGDFIRKETKVEKEMMDAISTNFNDKELLRQSFEAVGFLHSIGYIHRNLHPNNFLISCVDLKKEQFLIKLTDFQLSKKASQKIHSGPQTKKGWKAPESDDSEKVDAFIMGCYSYYVLTKGEHPFGETPSIQETNIKDSKNQCDVYKDDWEGGDDWKKAHTQTNGNLLSTNIHETEATWALKMIKNLIKKDPLKRESVEDVLVNEYFQPKTYQIYNHPVAKKPGLCVIVTQEKYHNPAIDLCYEDYSGGTYTFVKEDTHNIIKTFSPFGYDIISLRNLLADEIIKYLSTNELLKILKKNNEEAKKSEPVPSFKDYASLVVCFLGHGSQGVVYGVDEKEVSLNKIQYDAFDDNHCPDLTGKPKVFIILACQGGEYQKEIQKHSNEVVASDSPSTLATPTSNSNHEERNRPPVFDFIRLMATIEGYAAEGTTKGSSFINSLSEALNYEYKELLLNEEKEKSKFEKKEKEILKKSLGKRDLTQLFTTFVTPFVGSNKTSWQTPEFRSSLSKTIRFRRIRNSTEPIEPIEPFYDGENESNFIEARKHKIKEGSKTKKRISVDDYNALLLTIYGETAVKKITHETKGVQKAIAWVILNRYNENRNYWGGNKSLKSVCKHQGTYGFEYWKAGANRDKPDETIMNNLQKWLDYTVYVDTDPSRGATVYFLNNELPTLPHNLLYTTQIGDCHFYKLT